MKTKFQLFTNVMFPNDGQNTEFRILETVETSDGLRTRVADGLHREFDEAVVALRAKIEKGARS